MTETDYSAASAAVAAAFVAAFPEFLQARLDVVAPDVDVAEGIRQGRQWLAGELNQWAALPSDGQRQGPLQIFQTAVAFPTAALESAGVSPVTRDAGAAQALPGDLYSLAPASSREIGEAAWRAHVGWGIAKAKLVAAAVPKDGSTESSALAMVTMDQADRASVHLVATGRGIPVRHWRNPGAIAVGLEQEAPRWGVVDSSHAVADEAVKMLADAGCKVVVYGPAPDDIAMARWMALGAATVTARERLVAVLESWLPLQT